MGRIINTKQLRMKAGQDCCLYVAVKVVCLTESSVHVRKTGPIGVFGSIITELLHIFTYIIF